ncbi:hypothetical protein MD484_g2202, partial [Candolleomyces efflorescens]
MPRASTSRQQEPGRHTFHLPYPRIRKDEPVPRQNPVGDQAGSWDGGQHGVDGSDGDHRYIDRPGGNSKSVMPPRLKRTTGRHLSMSLPVSSHTEDHDSTAGSDAESESAASDISFVPDLQTASRDAPRSPAYRLPYPPPWSFHMKYNGPAAHQSSETTETNSSNGTHSGYCKFGYPLPRRPTDEFTMPLPPTPEVEDNDSIDGSDVESESVKYQSTFVPNKKITSHGSFRLITYHGTTVVSPEPGRCPDVIDDAPTLCQSSTETQANPSSGTPNGRQNSSEVHEAVPLDRRSGDKFAMPQVEDNDSTSGSVAPEAPLVSNFEIATANRHTSPSPRPTACYSNILFYVPRPDGTYKSVGGSLAEALAGDNSVPAVYARERYPSLFAPPVAIQPPDGEALDDDDILSYANYTGEDFKRLASKDLRKFLRIVMPYYGITSRLIRMNCSFLFKDCLKDYEGRNPGSVTLSSEPNAIKRRNQAWRTQKQSPEGVGSWKKVNALLRHEFCGRYPLYNRLLKDDMQEFIRDALTIPQPGECPKMKAVRLQWIDAHKRAFPQDFTSRKGAPSYVPRNGLQFV